jgi:hypothetical protein
MRRARGKADSLSARVATTGCAAVLTIAQAASFDECDLRLRGRLSVDQIPSLNDAEQHDDNRYYEEEVDETSERVGRDEPDEPQSEEDDEDC